MHTHVWREKHQQGIILDRSGLRPGHPYPLLATRQVGIGKVVQVRSSLLCTNPPRLLANPKPEMLFDIHPPNYHRQNTLTRRRPKILHNGLPYLEATQPKILTDPPSGRSHTKKALSPCQHSYWARSSFCHGLVGGCMRAIWSGVEISCLLSLMSLFSGVMMACHYFPRCLFCC